MKKSIILDINLAWEKGGCFITLNSLFDFGFARICKSRNIPWYFARLFH